MDSLGVDTYYESGSDDTLQKIVNRMYPQKKVLALADIETYKNLITNFKTV
jgi:[acyl-carrier-protein] S-malonyltransferase